MLQKGDIVGDRFEVLQPLGAGLIGMVYRARDLKKDADDGSVALKVLRPGAEPADIRKEAMILASLREEEEKVNDGLHSVPDLIAAVDSGPQPFLAMEFMRGKRVSQMLVLVENEPNGLDEQIGLNIARQLARLLWILHERLHKTYTDMKFENLWWEAEAKTESGVGRLRVTDWNVLRECESSKYDEIDPVQVDLFHNSLYLYRILTGRLPDLRGRILVSPWDESPDWKQITFGTQQLLNRAFSSDLSERFPSAFGLRKELERLYDYWQSDYESLVLEANSLLRKAEMTPAGQEKERSTLYDRTWDAYTTARKRQTKEKKEPDQRLNYIEANLRPDIEPSILLFEAKDKAAVDYAARISKYPSVDKLALHWWLKILQYGQLLGERLDAVRAFLAEAAKAYIAQDFQSAEEIFERNLGILASEEIGADAYQLFMQLRDTIRARSLALLAEVDLQKGRIPSASAKYEEILVLLQKIPIELLPESFKKGVEKDLAYLKDQLDAKKKASEGLRQFAKGNRETAREKEWKIGFRCDPTSPELKDAVLNTIRVLIGSPSRRNLDEANKLIEIIPADAGCEQELVRLKQQTFEAETSSQQAPAESSVKVQGREEKMALSSTTHPQRCIKRRKARPRPAYKETESFDPVALKVAVEEWPQNDGMSGGHLISSEGLFVSTHGWNEQTGSSKSQLHDRENRRVGIKEPSIEETKNLFTRYNDISCEFDGTGEAFELVKENLFRQLDQIASWAFENEDYSGVKAAITIKVHLPISPIMIVRMVSDLRSALKDPAAWPQVYIPLRIVQRESKNRDNILDFAIRRCETRIREDVNKEIEHVDFGQLLPSWKILKKLEREFPNDAVASWGIDLIRKVYIRSVRIREWGGEKDEEYYKRLSLVNPYKCLTSLELLERSYSPLLSPTLESIETHLKTLNTPDLLESALQSLSGQYSLAHEAFERWVPSFMEIVKGKIKQHESEPLYKKKEEHKSEITLALQYYNRQLKDYSEAHKYCHAIDDKGKYQGNSYER